MDHLTSGGSWLTSCSEMWSFKEKKIVFKDGAWTEDSLRKVENLLRHPDAFLTLLTYKWAASKVFLLSSTHQEAMSHFLNDLSTAKFRTLNKRRFGSWVILFSNISSLSWCWCGGPWTRSAACRHNKGQLPFWTWIGPTHESCPSGVQQHISAVTADVNSVKTHTKNILLSKPMPNILFYFLFFLLLMFL